MQVERFAEWAARQTANAEQRLSVKRGLASVLVSLRQRYELDICTSKTDMAAALEGMKDLEASYQDVLASQAKNHAQRAQCTRHIEELKRKRTERTRRQIALQTELDLATTDASSCSKQLDELVERESSLASSLEDYQSKLATQRAASDLAQSELAKADRQLALLDDTAADATSADDSSQHAEDETQLQELTRTKVRHKLT